LVLVLELVLGLGLQLRLGCVRVCSVEAGMSARKPTTQRTTQPQTERAQVWNTNPVVGVVGVFNVQGSSWDRIRRKFLVHSRYPPTLSTTISAADVEPFRAAGTTAVTNGGQQQYARQPPAAGSGSDSDADQCGSSASAEPLTFASYQFTTQELRLMPDASTSIPITLEASGADMLWFSPVLKRRGVALAPLGLADMYNGGGAITSVSLSTGPRRSRRLQQPGGGGGGDAAPSSSTGAGPELVASIGVRGCGRLLLYSSKRPVQVWVNMAPRDFEFEQYTGRLVVNVPQAAEGMEAEVEVMYD